MIKNFIILSLCFVAISGDGEFSILSNPESVSFSGDQVLGSQYVGEVINAVLGNPISTEPNWDGLIIHNPFELAKKAFAVIVDGIEHIDISPKAKTYGLKGGHGAESLSDLAEDLEASNVRTCFIDFSKFDEAVSAYKGCFGNIAIKNVEGTKYLNSATNNDDKQFLQSIAYLNAAADNLSNMIKSSNFLAIRIPLNNVAKIHGGNSNALNEALALMSNAVAKINIAAQKSSQSTPFVVVVAEKSSESRIKRDTAKPSNEKNDLNLAEFYSPDYPVIFNIILWFMVVFGLSLLAICYAIGSMDPGRDSIIYRMTSTRMKKDN